MSRQGAAGNSPPGRRAAAVPTRRSRAASPRRAAARPAPDRRRQTALTARAAVLAVALASVALAVALPFKIWLAQRGDIASLTAQTRQAQRQVDGLTAQQKQWNDKAYVEQQARQRLHYVMPGQKTYVVLGSPTRHSVRHPAATPSTGSTAPWYSQLWRSVQSAGSSGASRR